MKNRFYLFFFALTFILCVPCAFADALAYYVKYECRSDFGSIKISEELARGNKYCNYLANKNNIAQLAKQNIFSCEVGARKTYRLASKLDGHLVVTTITIDPAPGHGYGGAIPSKHVELTIDGRKKIDCTFGYSPWLNDITVSSISVFPNDDTMHIDADHSGNKLFSSPSKFWDAATFLSNRTAITDQILLKAAQQK